MNKTVFYLLLSLSATLSLPFSAALAATSTDLSTWTWSTDQVSGTFALGNNGTSFSSLSIAGFESSGKALTGVTVTLNGNISSSLNFSQVILLGQLTPYYYNSLSMDVAFSGSLNKNGTALGSSTTQSTTGHLGSNDANGPDTSFYANTGYAPVHFGSATGTENFGIDSLTVVDTTAGLADYTGGTLTLDTSLVYGTVGGKNRWGNDIRFSVSATTDFSNAKFNTSSSGSDTYNSLDAAKEIAALSATVVYHFTTVPEPTSMALLGLGCVLFLVRRRKPAAK